MGLFDRIFNSQQDDTSSAIPWVALQDIAQLDELVELSQSKDCLILKHSTRCSISSMALDRLERSWNLDEAQVTPYYLDLIAYRPISNAIAERFGVMHESPQVLLVRQGKVIFHNSHNSISVQSIAEVLA